MHLNIISFWLYGCLIELTAIVPFGKRNELSLTDYYMSKCAVSGMKSLLCHCQFISHLQFPNVSRKIFLVKWFL